MSQYAAFEHVNDSVMLRTMEGIINFWNRSAENLYGWRKEEAVGRVSHELLKTQFPRPLKEIESELIRNGRWQGKLVHTTRDGDRVVVESRWVLDPATGSESVVEINVRSADHTRDVTETSTLGNARPEEVKRRELVKAEELLINVANVIVLVGAFACLMIVAYLLYYYTLTGQRHFTSSAGMVLYYGLPAALGVLLFISLRLSPVLRSKLALVLVSTCIGLYGLELILAGSAPAIVGFERTLWFPPVSTRDLTEIISVAKQYGVDFDVRSKLDVIGDLQKKGISAVPAIVPHGLLKPDTAGTLKSRINVNGTDLLPLAGVADKVTVLCNENGRYVTYESDEYGFHNPKGIWNSRAFDIAVLGDSYTHGYCVPSEKNFVALIRQRYPGTLNLGVAGAGPLSALALIKEYLQAAKPRLVLWVFFEGNDLIDLKRERNSPLLMHYLGGDFSQGLMGIQSNIDAALLKYIEEAGREVEHSPQPEEEAFFGAGTLATLKLSNLRGRLGMIYAARNAEITDQRVTTEDELELLAKILARAKATVSQWGGAIYFVYLPERDRYVDRKVAKIDDGNRERVLKIAEISGFPVIDINDVFGSQKDPLDLFPFRRLGHYNEQGHTTVAKAILESLSVKN
jgi:PAS domain S-box-containing protein